MTKKLHLFVGLLMLVIFLLSGQYLKMILPPMDMLADGQRMMYRASHVYLMMAGAINLVAGVYYQRFSFSLASRIQQLGSAQVLLAPWVLLIAFMVEPGNPDSKRLITMAGGLLLFTGVVTVAVAASAQYFNDKQQS